MDRKALGLYTHTHTHSTSKIKEGSNYFSYEKSEKGITLIALVVTIIILLILAAVSIGMVFNGEGLFSRAEGAALEHRGGKVEDEVAIWKNDKNMAKYSGDSSLSKEELINAQLAKGLLTETEAEQARTTGIVTIGSKTIDYNINEEQDETEAKDYFTYEYDTETKTATLTGIKEEYAVMSHYIWDYHGVHHDDMAPLYIKNGNKIITDLIIPETTEYESNTYTVTSIGNESFGSSSFTPEGSQWQTISIPDSVITIGDHAFDGFTKVTNIILPKSLKNIGKNAFSNCTSLTSIKIPENVKTIGDYAFYVCSSLAHVEYPLDIENIGYEAFSRCSLTSISLPNDLNAIGYGWISYNYGITNITIPENATFIGDGWFYGCSGLTNITIPDGVTTIGRSAFYNCSGLTSINIPEGVTSIEQKAFSYCSSLTSITIPSSVTTISNSSVYSERPFDDTVTIYLASGSTLTIPEGNWGAKEVIKL